MDGDFCDEDGEWKKALSVAGGNSYIEGPK